MASRALISSPRNVIGGAASSPWAEPAFPLIYISHNVTKFGHDPKKLMASAIWSSGLIDPEDQPKVHAAMTRMLENLWQHMLQDLPAPVVPVPPAT